MDGQHYCFSYNQPNPNFFPNPIPPYFYEPLAPAPATDG